jgi:CubicO group peptidase (beta-lactamase class C family)
VRGNHQYSIAFNLRIILVLGLLLLFFTPLSNVSGNDLAYESTISSTREYWPTDGWRYSTPQEQGMDNETLYEMMDLIEEEEYPIRSVLVIKNGYAVFEKYPTYYASEHTLTVLHSVTKSFTSTLIGIAVQQGLISVNDTVLSFFQEYEIANSSSLKDSMTIEDLLTMTSGIEWDEWSLPYEFGSGNPLMEMMASSDAVQYVLDRQMSHTPGEHWNYNGGASLLLSAIVQQASNQTTLSFAIECLFAPLGFGPAVWYEVAGGWRNAFGGLCLTTRDLAKLGFLYLNNGTWNGMQIISSYYVSNATHPIDIPNPLGSYFGYGWHWWTRSDLGIYFAYGRHGQKIMVSPEHDLVVAFTANIPDNGYDPEFVLFRDYILSAIVEKSNDTTLPTLGILTVSGIGVFAIVIFFGYRRTRVM